MERRRKILYEDIKIGVATLVLIAGVVLTFISLYMPPEGEISGSVLAALGQFLAFSGGIYGIGYYGSIQVRKIDKEYELKSNQANQNNQNNPNNQNNQNKEG